MFLRYPAGMGNSRLRGLGTVVIAFVVLGCSEDPDRGGGASTSSNVLNPGTCDPDILATGLVAEQTGVSADIADCPILKWTAEYGEPDPMIVKAMIYGESRFDYA